MIDEKWDRRFLRLASHIAEWSKDPSTKVGCVIVDGNRNVVSVGYNGFPRGVADHTGRYANREIKYLMTQHAESNAVTSAREPLAGHTAYVTHPPCSNCSGILIQAGIKRIVTRPPDAGLAKRFSDSFSAASIMCKEAEVEVVYIVDETNGFQED